MKLSFKDGETVYVGYVHDVDVSLDITLDNNIRQLNAHAVSTQLTRNIAKRCCLN